MVTQGYEPDIYVMVKVIGAELSVLLLIIVREAANIFLRHLIKVQIAERNVLHIYTRI